MQLHTSHNRCRLIFQFTFKLDLILNYEQECVCGIVLIGDLKLIRKAHISRPVYVI